MELYVLNSKFEKIAVIDEVDSILWNKRFSEVGYCEIHTSFNNRLLDYLQIGNYLMRLDDDMLCIIKKITIETNVQNGNYLTVNALDMKCILNQRIVWNTINFEGKVCDFIEKVLTDNIIGPKTSARKITNFILDKSNFSEFTDTFSYVTEHENVLTLITDICNDYNYGFQVTLNGDNQFVFKLLKKVDKSNISNNKYVEFSPAFSNILSSNYSLSYEGFKNVVLVGGEKKDDTQIFADYGISTGLNRYELYTDSNISKTYKDENEKEHTYTDEEYRQILINAGKLVLINNGKSENFNGEVDVLNTYIYKTDYNIGDIVRVKNEYGIEAPATIIGVMESQDNDNGYVVEPQFEY